MKTGAGDDAEHAAPTRRELRRVYVAPTDRLITGPFVVIAACAFAFFMYIGTLVPLIPLYIEGPLGEKELGVGLNVVAFAVAAVAARPLLGSLANRYGRRAIIIGGALLATVGGLGISQVESLIPLLAFRALTGAGEAAVFVGAATLIADLSPPHRRAEGASYFSVALYTGIGLGPVVGEWVLNDTEFERTFIMASCFALFAAVVAIFAPNRVVPPGESDAAPVAVTRATVERTGIHRLVHPEAIMPGVVMALGVSALTTFFVFVPQHSRDLGMGSSSGLFALYALTSVLIRVFGATWPERLGPRRMVTVALCSFGLGLTLVGAVGSVVVLWPAAILVGTGAAFLYPSLNALTVNRVSDDDRAIAVSSFTMFFEIGGAVSGLAIGGLAEVVGKQNAFFGGVVFVVIGLYVLRVRVVPAGAPDAGPVRTPAPATS